MCRQDKAVCRFTKAVGAQELALLPRLKKAGLTESSPLSVRPTGATPVALEMSLLPKFAGQSANGQGTGKTK